MQPDQIPDEISSKLYKHQIPHVRHLRRCIRQKTSILDSSDPGSGKTATTAALAKWCDLGLFVCCPKSVVAAWFRFAEMFNVRLVGITNYEALRCNKYYKSLADFNNEKRTECPWITITKGNIVVKFPLSTMIVFDEAHNGKNCQTTNYKLLVAIQQALFIGPTIHKCKLVILSATISETFKDFRMTACMLGICQYEKHAYNAWLRMIEKNNPGIEVITVINNILYPDYGGRMSIDAVKAQESPYDFCYPMFKCFRAIEMGSGDLNATTVHGLDISGTFVLTKDVFRLVLEYYHLLSSFKHSDISAVVVDMSPEVEAEISQQHAEIELAVKQLKTQQIGEIHPLTLILRARQRIEMLKVPAITEMAMEYLLREYAVVIFVNFTDTIIELAKELVDFVHDDIKSTVASVVGGQKPTERASNIKRFQDGSARLILVNISAGGAAISLHHENLNAKPRISLISPPWSGTKLRQSLGRINRLGSLSETKQLIIYCKGKGENGHDGNEINDTTFNVSIKNIVGQTVTVKRGIEEIMAINLNKKLRHITWLNTGSDDGVEDLDIDG